MANWGKAGGDETVFAPVESNAGNAQPHAVMACALPEMPGSAFLRGVGANFLAAHHKIHELLPVLEKPVGRQSLEVLKELSARAHRGAD